MDLSLTARAHTIPRFFTFTVSPGANIELYANSGADGLPSADSYSWKGELVANDKIITIRPTDAAYVAGKYLVSIITTACSVEFTLHVEVAAFSMALKYGVGVNQTKCQSSSHQGQNQQGENGGKSKSVIASDRTSILRRNLRAPAGVARVIELGERSGKAILQLLAVTNSRKRQYRFGAPSSPAPKDLSPGATSAQQGLPLLPVRPGTA